MALARGKIEVMAIQLFIDSKFLVNFTQKLIQTPSLSGKEDKVAKIVTQEMKKVGFDKVWIDPKGNVIGHVFGSTGSPTLMFNGHLDHVPPGEMKDPYSAKIVDGTSFGVDGKVIFGRGVVDMKGAIATLIYAIDAVKKSGTKLTGNVIATFTVKEEEGRGEGVAYMLQNDDVEADFAVNMEATTLRVYLGHRGKIDYKITTKGRTSHASNPSRGINAIFKMNEFLNMLQKEYKLPSHRDLGDCTYTVLDIASSPGGKTPIVPDRCEIILDTRFLPGENRKTIEYRIRDIISKLEKQDPEFEADIEFVKMFPAAYTEPDEKIVSLLQKARSEALGSESELGCWIFGTEGAFLNNFGIPCAGFGPGNEEFAHTPEENMPINDIIAAAQVYAQLIVDVCGTKGVDVK